MIKDRDYFLPRDYLRRPIPELFECAWLLDRAVSAHLLGELELAASLIKEANMPIVRDYAESLWGSAKSWPDQVHYKRLRRVDTLPAPLPKHKDRMPGRADKLRLAERDGFNCRYCGIPVIPAEVRKSLCIDYPDLEIWGRTNATQHAGFQALWLQYDHVIPAAMGGASTLENIVISCAGCNYCKFNYHLDELGLKNPLHRPILKTSWDGLLRYQGGFEKWRP